ncbi:MAG TPA: DUF1524 domain-containing protein, partial [Leptospiraceae bacterium]|nr:DUF1524 domain-containing protein [Leptospiraceae bacterium]
NLTIITQSLNASLRDADWKTKLNGNGNKKGLTTYSAGLETVSDCLTLADWNEEEIEKRAKFLFDKAKDIWKV